MGYTATQLLSINATGNVYITGGINKLIETKDIDGTFPGFQTATERGQGMSAVTYPGYKAPMTADQIKSRCGAVINNPPGVGVTKGHGLRKPVTGRFSITVNRPGGAGTARAVIGARPPHLTRAAASLAAAGRTFAAGVDRGGDIRLTARRSLKPGKYVLRLRTSPVPVTHGRRGTAFQIVHIPIRLR